MTDTSNEPQRETRTPRWVKLVLVLSLALNLVIVGIVAGVLTRKDRPGPGGFAGYALPYVIALPRDERPAVFRSIRRAGRAGEMPDRAQRRAPYEEMMRLLRADPLDLEAVQQVLNRHTDLAVRSSKVAQDVWLEHIKAYDAAERAAYADRLQVVLDRGPRRAKRDK